MFKEAFHFAWPGYTYTLTIEHEKRKCFSHGVSNAALRHLVLKTIRTASVYSIENKSEFIERVRAASEVRQQAAAKDLKRRIGNAKKRIAGNHRLEAAKRLGWTEIECSVRKLDGLQAELAEIDENFVRTPLTPKEQNDLLLRRKPANKMSSPKLSLTGKIY